MDKSIPSALWHATNANHTKMVQLLLEFGADLNHQEPDGTSPLILAQAKQMHPMLEIMKELELDNTPRKPFQKYSFLAEMKHQFPLFNDEISKQVSTNQSKPKKIIRIDDVQKVLLKPFCPMKQYLKSKIISDFEWKTEMCSKFCKQ